MFKLQFDKFAQIAGFILACAVSAVHADPQAATAQQQAPAQQAPAPIAKTPVPVNPVLNFTQLPNFQNINIDDFAPAVTMAIQDYNGTLNIVLKSPITWDATLQPLEEQIHKIKTLWNLLNIVNNQTQTQQSLNAINNVAAQIGTFHNNLMHNKGLHNAYLTLKNSPEFAKLSPTQQVAINQTILDFKLNGAELNATQLQRYTQIIQRLNELANQFNSNLAAATSSWQYFIPLQDEKRLDGLPDFTKKNAAAKAQATGKSGWVFTLDNPSLVAVETYAKDRILRKTLYTAFATLAPDNTPIIAETLKLRQELAVLLGFENYAAYTAADRQPPDPTQAMQFLQDLAKLTKPAAIKDYKQLQEFAKLDKVDNLQLWDIAYYSQWNKATVAADSQTKSMEYLPTTTVIQGLSNLASIVFNIEIYPVPDASTWNDKVKLYAIADMQNNIYGYFYLDLYTRTGKNNYPTTTMYTTRLHAKTSVAPVAVISTNFASNNGLMTHEDFTILFAQFGEMLQRILATLDYPGLSAPTGMTLDAIAFTNQYMQNWAWQKQVIKDIAKNYKTAAAIPEDLLNSLLATRYFNAALNLSQQLQMAMLDLRLHLNLPEDADKSAQDIFVEIRKDYNILPIIDPDLLPNRLAQTFTTEYASSYYTYYWDKALACDVFAAFKSNGLFSAKIGQKLRENILEPGGQASLLELFEKFRGRAPDPSFLIATD